MVNAWDWNKFLKKDDRNLNWAVLSLQEGNCDEGVNKSLSLSVLTLGATFAPTSEPEGSPYRLTEGRSVMLKINAKNLEKITIVTLQGEIETAQTEILEGVEQSLSETSAVILDLARVSRIDAHGLGVLLELREQAQTRGIRFELMNVSKFLRGVLEMTHLDAVFQITSEVEFFRAAAAERRPSVTPLRSCA